MSKYLFLISMIVLLGCVFGHGDEEEEALAAIYGDVPFCECVNATINCDDDVTLDGLLKTLLDRADVCLNECSDECQAAFYPLHAYHELCPHVGDEAGELYHELALSCQVCDPSDEGTPINRPVCPTVNCTDSDHQKELISFLNSIECQMNCMINSDCIEAWTRLSSYHETCFEEHLSHDLTMEYHEIEDICPPECAPIVTEKSDHKYGDCGK